MCTESAVPCASQPRGSDSSEGRHHASNGHQPASVTGCCRVYTWTREQFGPTSKTGDYEQNQQHGLLLTTANLATELNSQPVGD